MKTRARAAWAVLVLALAAPAAGDNAKAGQPGFRLESVPKIEKVFGDAAGYKKIVDRFHSVHGEMDAARRRFSRNVQAVIASLEGHAAVRGKRQCPTDAVAPSYAVAFHEGQRFHELGKELQQLHASIANLHRLGETRGLTPDYRWKVARALKIYEQILVDFREMKSTFDNQLAQELTYYGCAPAELIARGDEIRKSREAGDAGAVAARDPLASPQRDSSAVPAKSATFFVDNSSCAGALRVFLDGLLLGEVSARAKAAFRTPVGHHELCLIPSASPQSCGDPGTVRKTYIHDGWTITMRCQ